MEYTPDPIVERMFSADAYSQWLGIERLAEEPGACTLRLTVRPDMLNGFAIAHGGITYSLADSALAFASNSRGRQAVSVETAIAHLHPVQPGDILIARAREEHLGHRIARYRVEVTNQTGHVVAIFNGTVYRSNREW
ncbi:MAG: hydroxyphenylacetyl-CoA thioesterase PaaI [Lewinellaceae bacterium]|nr:hydroxyphenylacetyl-CoA thioesterase PaaI [Lewinellaceae bacterium]